jgi:hypothetical protein
MTQSEAASKKLGRPQVFSEEALTRVLASGVSPTRRVTTKRGAHDLMYRVRAVLVIDRFRQLYPDEAASLAWLCMPGDMRGETWRHSLLTELGRITNPQALIPVALYVARLQPSTKEGIRAIRQLRRSNAWATADQNDARNPQSSPMPVAGSITLQRDDDAELLPQAR